MRKDGSTFPAEVSSHGAALQGVPTLVSVVRDITERRRAEAYRQMGEEILGILSRPGNRSQVLGAVLSTVRAATGVDAVGLRLEVDGDYPYYVQQGFSDDFVQKESSLVVRRKGDVCRDRDGEISLECTCGLVLSGKRDPDNSLFTRGGSIWTNDSLPYLEVPPNEDPRTHPRNECIHHGYRSVALIPVRAKGRVVGLLQLNARSPGRFTDRGIETLERVGENVGEAMLRKQAEETAAHLLEQTRRDAEAKGRLLREINHRVKNNLVSLLGLLLAEKQGGTEEARPHVEATVDRLSKKIRGMIAAHEMLSETEWAPLPLAELSNRVLSRAFDSGAAAGRVSLTVEPSEVRVSPRQVSSLALALSELATNTLKYALPDQGIAKVGVRVREDDDECVLEYRDDGPGYPEAVLAGERLSVGLQLISGLVAGSLSGALDLASDGGAVARIRIRKEDLSTT